MAANESNDIGIIGMEAYFPRYYVEQKELGKPEVIFCSGQILNSLF